MVFATNKMRILGETKDPKTGAFTPKSVGTPPAKPKPAKKSS
jgi:hypothetical protein